jgi:hypothetical protein
MKRITAVLTAICLWACLLPSTGCNQSTISALVSTLGTAAASIATLEGQTALAAKLQTDTAAAAAIIKNWKQGTPAQNAIEAINLVIDDLNLICPAGGVCGPYAPLVLLALGTAESIIQILNPAATVYGTKMTVQKTNLGHYPATAKDFKTQWNNYCGTNASLAPLAIK